MASGALLPFTDYDDDFDEPLPPSQAELDLEVRVFDVVKHLDQADGELDIPWALDLAIRYLTRYARDRKGLRPDADDRDRMLRAAVRARAGAKAIPSNYPPGNFAAGMDAVAALIVYWSETDEARATRHPDLVADLFAYATLLRRDLTNMIDASYIRDRAKKRRGAIITEIHATALRGGTW